MHGFLGTIDYSALLNESLEVEEINENEQPQGSPESQEFVWAVYHLCLSAIYTVCMNCVSSLLQQQIY